MVPLPVNSQVPPPTGTTLWTEQDETAPIAAFHTSTTVLSDDDDLCTYRYDERCYCRSSMTTALTGPARFSSNNVELTTETITRTDDVEQRAP